MKIFVHDYAGHPFQVQLSRELARRGHCVAHFYSAAHAGPRGRLASAVGDPPNLCIDAVDIGRTIRKSHLHERWKLERQYGAVLVRKVEAVEPDVVLSANTPLDAQAILLACCRKSDVSFVYWAQDLIGEAMVRLLSARLGAFGRLVGLAYKQRERHLLHRSDAVIAISEGFRPALDAANVLSSRSAVIPNWAPLEELPMLPRDNGWAREHGLSEKFVFLYAGTLGFKHDPGKLLGLATEFRDRLDVQLVVVSEGEGADWLKEQAAHQGLPNLVVLPFQPFDRMPEVLASADVLLAILEADAGVFSVPSKVLTYHCAGRPLVLSVPSENLAARIVLDQATGLVSEPNDPDGFRAHARLLYDDASRCQEMGRAARKYAERNFDVGQIASRFEKILAAAGERPRQATS